jgi:hypothetical protein
MMAKREDWDVENFPQAVSGVGVWGWGGELMEWMRRDVGVGKASAVVKRPRRKRPGDVRCSA